MARTPRFSIDLRAVVYRDQRWWCAHCLEMDLVASADSPEQAVRDLVGSIKIQLEQADRTGDMDAILRAAPPEYWNMYFRAQASKTKIKPSKPIHRIEIRELAA